MDKMVVKIILEGSKWILTFLKGKIKLLDHLNKELSTFIKYVSVMGLSLPFLAIFKGKKVLDHWFI
jgi:hypothetical protein